MLRSSSRAVATLLFTRALMEAIGFACLLGIAQTAGGAAPLALTPATLALLGTTLVLVAALRETGSEKRGTAIVAATLFAGVILAVVLPAHRLDVVSWGGRVLAFAILAEIYLWRVLSLARGAVRWSDARNAAPFAAAALAIAAVLPLAVDRGPLVPLALVLIAATGVALSVARSTEELSLAGENAGGAKVSSAHSLVFVLGLGAMVAALVTPVVEQLLAEVGARLGPAFDQLLFFILLPLGYLAALVYAILAPFLHPVLANLRPAPLRTPEEEEALLREIERTRPFVVGGVEILIVIGVLLVALVLLERAVRERRIALPDGAALERSRAEGLSLGDTLLGLFPARPARRRPPRDDGSTSAALRLVYWRLLALAERAGHGWRVAAETPTEHQRRLAGADPRWDAAAPIVSAFENFRYGEVPPDRTTVSHAREVLRALEAAVRT
ncbi:MAG: hypothetical protein AUH33_02585 [Chloroflexi bacterium 13_1_40CM_68_21]|nr:MAG: hypothetical protein AUH33_02585 [Chloroflexi bacterium 13_1_40CM_68_21]